MADRHLGVDVGAIDTLQAAELGFRIQKGDGRTYRYMRAGAAIALGDVLTHDVAETDTPIHSVQPTSAADTIMVGCWPNENPGGQTARVAILDNQFFWMLEVGDALVKAAAATVAGAPATPSAVAGTVDDIALTAANAGAMAAGRGAYFITATTAGFARVMFT